MTVLKVIYQKPKLNGPYLAPRPPIVGVQDSIKYLKKLVAVAMSSILYYRGIFDEQDYGTINQPENKLHILSSKTQRAEAKRIMELMQGVFDALDKKCVKQIIIGFHKDKSVSHEYVEAYVIRFNYSDEETVVEASSHRYVRTH